MCTLHIVHIGTPHTGVCNGIPIIEAISVLSSLVQGLRMQGTRSIGQSRNRFNTQTETYGREQIVDHFRFDFSAGPDREAALAAQSRAREVNTHVVGAFLAMLALGPACPQDRFWLPGSLDIRTLSLLRS